MSNFANMNIAIRLKAAGIHLGLSGLVAVTSAILVFGIWYPWPFRSMSGGQSLFILVMTVDLILGPLLTFVAFNTKKPRKELMRDLAVIVALQLGGLAYGIYTVWLARPVAIVSEGERFRVVARIDVVQDELPKALPELRNLSLTGPKVLGTREPRNSNEKWDTISYALGGIDIGARPMYWLPYSAAAGDILKQSKPLSRMLKQYPKATAEIESYVKSKGRNPLDVKFLPVVSKFENWSALIDAKTGEVFGYVPYDGFI